MVRVSNWNVERYNGELIGASMDRLRKAANVLKDNAETILESKIGKGWGGTGKKRFNIRREPYKTGQYAGQDWTAREPGSLVKTLRVTEKREDAALVATFGRNRNIRVYAGNREVYWAKLFEYYQPFLRPAVNKSKAAIRNILENG